MPYVASEFGPLKEGIRRVDYIGRCFMTPSSCTCVGVEGAIQEWSGGAVKVTIGKGGGAEVATIG